MKIFYLGTHEPAWLARTDVPLFVSARRLRRRRSLPRAIGRWALDSGAFTELATYGHWTVTPAAYASEATRWLEAIGPADFVAPQDWPCEPTVRSQTGLTVAQHQWRTATNYLRLLELAPGVPWLPVLQGWTGGDYLRHVDLYRLLGVELAGAPRVGLGSVCRRRGLRSIQSVAGQLHAAGIRLHGFGVKVTGLALFGPSLESADSLAWSYHARRRPPLPGCAHAHCGNCITYAMQWLARISPQDRGLRGTVRPPLCTR